MSSWFPRPAAPKTLLADLRGVFTGTRRHLLVFGAMAIGMTSAIITLFVIDSHDNIGPGPQTIYVSDWSANRTDAEIIAQQKIDMVAIHKAKEERRKSFQRVDDAMKAWGF
ncbi:hypothetical protein FHS31_001557 [Sphingomonas vulcanisoli]|uniref:ABC transporter permease n=1 Tax=Sphingomonas vulcanisoli TaxID=1658060 RepID=A0ABX0TU72_9SPHN|nr:hypothetical protein [Sphingomonas vulcanisoli]NIJ07947.1 hypothetical protein [Sphingomonas vulcanisoli]